MAERWVVNSSPLIHLARIGHLDLLVKAGAEIWLPNAVAAEILAGPIGDAAQALIASGWGIRVEPSVIPNTVLEWGLGPGETAVIAIGTKSRDVTLILDDGRARTCARVHGLNVFGTLGLILRAEAQAAEEAAPLRMICDASGLGLELRDLPSWARGPNGKGVSHRRPTFFARCSPRDSTSMTR